MKSTTWRFSLTRHDDPPTDSPEPPATGEAAPDNLGDAGKKAIDAMKAERAAARAEAAAVKKQLAETQAKLTEYADRDKTDAEKLSAKAEAAEARAAAATARAVAAEVKALAVEEFADPTDAALLGDLGKYAQPNGDVDLDAIKNDLATLLTAKPHLKKGTGPRNPAPDPSQGRGGDNKPLDFRSAGKAEFDAELAKYGLRPRTYS